MFHILQADPVKPDHFQGDVYYFVNKNKSVTIVCVKYRRESDGRRFLSSWGASTGFRLMFIDCTVRTIGGPIWSRPFAWAMDVYGMWYHGVKDYLNAVKYGKEGTEEDKVWVRECGHGYLLD